MVPTKSPNPGNHCISWANFLTVIGIVLAAAVALNAFVWSQHAREMGQFEKRMDGQFDNVKDRLNKIDQKLEKR